MATIIKSSTFIKLITSITLLSSTVLAYGIYWNKYRIKSRAPLLNNLQPIQQLDINKYMGVWYEQRRIEAFFERGMNYVTANYSLSSDKQTVSVVNMGVLESTGQYSVSKATARYTDVIGVLMVSFLTFIEGAYVILYVDNDYTTAVVGSPTRKFLWLLTRNRQVQQQQIDIMHSVALKNGYTQEQLNNMIVGKHVGNDVTGDAIMSK